MPSTRTPERGGFRAAPDQARRVVACAVMAGLLASILGGNSYAYLPVFDGPCGDLDTELTDAAPHLLGGTVGIYACYFLPGQLSPGGAALLAASGGSSGGYAQVAAYELLRQCEGAVLLKTGDEVAYLDPGGKRTDALVEIGGVRLGLMVTRGVTYPFDSPLTLPQAQQLLEGAVDDVVMSSANVAPADAWQKQVLVVATTTGSNRDVLELAYQAIDPALQADTIVWIVHTTIEYAFLYDGSQPVCVGAPVVDIPGAGVRLEQNIPNPFNPRTVIAFELAERGPATLRVFDVAGRLVRTLVDGVAFEAGRQEVAWDGRDGVGHALASGTYIYRLDAGGEFRTKRMVLAR